MSSPNLEGLEIKEATPSIAPSIYESILYTRKWRILLAVAIGASLLGVCVLGFYLGAESNSSSKRNLNFSNSSIPSLIEGAHWLWRSAKGGECLTTQSDKCPKDFGDRILLMVSLGGLRSDQVNTIPAFVEIKRCGVTSPHFVPSYPTLNVPNLYTIATGLYPAFHGIVSSKMYDQINDLSFEDSPGNRTWWGGEPIWNTVNKQGKRSAAYLWPGSDVSIQARYPSYWQNEKLEFSQRMSKVLEWVGLPREERPHLIMLHYNEPSNTAQTHGIFSSQTDKKLYDIGLGLDELMSTLHRMEVFNCIDLIVLSDHGVAPFRCDDSIFVDDLLDDPAVEKIYTGPVGRLSFAKDADQEARNKVINKLHCQDNNLQALTKSQVPKRYHYTYGDRIGDLVLDTKVGSHVALESQQECLAGEFGYNNIAPSMQGVFMAHGVSFKKDYKADSFRNVEVYNLMCHILDITPSPNNGTQGSFYHLLTDEAMQGKHHVEGHSEIYLREILRPRPNRADVAVLGVDGRLDEDLQRNCKCDKNFEKFESPETTSTTAKPESPETPRRPESTLTTPSTTSSTTSTTTASITTTSASTIKSTESSSTFTSSGGEGDAVEPGDPSETLAAATISPTAQEGRTIPPKPAAQATENGEEGAPAESETPRKEESPPGKESEATGSRRIRSSASASAFVKEDDSAKISAIKSLHSPWGLPRFSAPEVSSDIVNILLQTNYIIGFPESLNLAIWTSFTLTKSHMMKVKETKPQISDGIPPNLQDIKEKNIVGCWIADPRLNRSRSDQCHRSLQKETFNTKDFSLRQLYPEEFETADELSSEGFLLSNVAPIRMGYERKGRRAMVKAIAKWVELRQEVNVLHGPLFDYDYDGKRDKITLVKDTIKPLIPSDYFFVITSCNSSQSLASCPHLELLSLTFVFPNTHREEGCQMTDEEYLLFHLTSIADVERTSGLRLFREIKTKDYARLKSVQHTQLFPFE